MFCDFTSFSFLTKSFDFSAVILKSTKFSERHTKELIGFSRSVYFVSWEPEGRYDHYSMMFCWYMYFKLRTRRALSLYKVYGDNVLLVLGWQFVSSMMSGNVFMSKNKTITLCLHPSMTIYTGKKSMCSSSHWNLLRGPNPVHAAAVKAGGILCRGCQEG